MSIVVTGPEFDEDESEFFRPVPHPDDRLWRHPSEMAAMQAAHANAETIEVPKITMVEQPRRSRRNTVVAIAAGVAVIGAAALTVGVMSAPRSQPAVQIADLPVASQADGARSAGGTTGVAAETNVEGQELLTNRIHEAISPSLPRIQAATADGMREGSGFFVTDSGHIATSAGLLDNAEYVLAWTQDGQRWRATVVAADPISDVAVIRIDSQGWPSASLGTAELRAGQYALALDHDENMISVGEVTAVGGPRVTVDQPAGLPGSAIVDDTGAVIAMLTADVSDSDDSTSPATPAWILERVAVDLISAGATTHTWLGVVIESYAASPGDMVQVSAVVSGSPAEEAGLRTGDLIDSMNGDPTPDAETLYRAIQGSEPGDEAVLTVTRNGSRRIIIATIAELTN